ncbi:MAG TPA: IS630 transposase-related protein [Alphaproteobacteria bacterium]|nr:helix-turn-helix domain-containing protein [Alphaproteobacteria bacterium]HOO49998.1 IS630 transposase-related protein [Alphaproteobacteria bacterium]
MRCSSDIRRRVVKFVRDGGGKREAALRFGVGEASVYRWMAQEDAEAYTKPGPRSSRKISLHDLSENVLNHADWTIAERARYFKVSVFCIHYNLKKLRISRKKNDAVHATRHYEKEGLSASS